MKVIFFAQARAAAGREAQELEVSQPLTQAELWDKLVEEFPALAELRKTSRLARNEVYLQPGEVLFPDDEVVMIPPVSGG